MTRFLLIASVAVLLPTVGAATIASGQDRPRAAVLSPEAPTEADAGLASAFERVLRARLEALEVVAVEGTPALNLADLQLAVGCVAETDACLRAVAEQLEVDALVIPTLDRAGDALVSTVTYFVAAGPESKQATRRAEGERAPNTLLAEVDPMVREIFDLPPPEEPIEPDVYEIDPGGGPPPPPPEDGVSPVPFIVGGVGIAALAAGVAFGLLSESTEGEYADAPTGSPDQVDEAIALREDAEKQALVANVLLGVGGALVVGGVALFLALELPGDEEPPPADGPIEAAVAPWLSPTGGGVAVTGRFGGAL